MLIYKYTNTLNGKSYIGLTTRTLKERHAEHIKAIGDGTYFHNALKKYGEKNFTLEQIDTATSIDDLKQKEMYWIDFYKTFAYRDDSEGYNCTLGGDGSAGLSGERNPQFGISPQERMSEETFKKWKKNLVASAARGEKHRFYGKHPKEWVGEESWEVRMEKQRELWASDKNPRKINPPSGKKNPMYGRRRTESEKRNISRGQTNKKLTEEDVVSIRKLYASGEFIYKEIAVRFDISPTTVGEIVRGDIYSHVANNFDYREAKRNSERRRTSPKAAQTASNG
jgi:group I intron endonuclease